MRTRNVWQKDARSSGWAAQPSRTESSSSAANVQKRFTRRSPRTSMSLDYKLHPDFRGRFEWHPDTSDAHLNGTRLKSRTLLKPASMKVLRKYRKPPTRGKGNQFDLKTKANKPTLSDHWWSHNTPKPQPAG